jgi:choline dehydrogenase-like flavoprotein
MAPQNYEETRAEKGSGAGANSGVKPGAGKRAGAGALPRHYDHIVVGAGINGSCAALQLTRRGARVLLLEKVRHKKDIINGENRKVLNFSTFTLHTGTICGKDEDVAWCMEPLGRFPRVLNVPPARPEGFWPLVWPRMWPKVGL